MSERVGRYRLQEVIGVGSFATVHRALDERLDDEVVVKMLAENHSLNPEVRERFIAEGRSLRKVRSPHVVTVHDIGESERQQPYLVLQHADRGTLADRVARLWRLGWVPNRADVRVVARSLASAVEAVHRANLVHRDLSPGNILLTSVPEATGDTGAVPHARDGAAVVRPGERLLVADLGMCKDLARHSGLTVAAGTSGFRPPEQGKPGVIDTRADLWAMSALLKWMCDRGGADLPAGLFTALERGLAPDPRDRHPDTATWLADIEGALDTATDRWETTGARPTGDRAPLSDPRSARAVGARPKRFVHGVRQSAAFILGSTALLLLAGGFFIGLRVGWGPPAESGQAAIAIQGPEQIAVGEQATFTAEVQGVDSWVWSLPTGAHVLDEPAVRLTASSAGSARVVLRAVAPDGTDLQAVHPLTVTE
ncbi:MAG TPA: serine/threonine-protein kinase [Beutenbergiaceae bacterium]|nr:serine/threonine-protein kinase [Beutenbergiaceae bacterium]